MTATADVVNDELRVWKRRKAPPTHREFARTLLLPAGPFVGTSYDPASDPVQSYLIDQLDAGKWERIYWSGSPQKAGKTLAAVLVPALRGAIRCGLPIGYGLPTLADLDKAWATKLKPAIEKSGYKNYLPKSGPGSKGGRGPTLQFYDPDDGSTLGNLTFLAGDAYGDTVAAVIIDEIDSFRKADGTPQWEGIDNIFSRTGSYGRKALRIGVGTIEDDNESIILTLINVEASGTRCWQQCPHCQAYQVIDKKQIVYEYILQGASGAQTLDEDAVRSSARIVCVNCAVGWTEEDRLQSLRTARFAHRGQRVDSAGTILGDAPRTSRLGLLTPAWTSTIADLREIALGHAEARRALEATHNPAAMRKWVRYMACELYVGTGESDVPNTIDLHLAARADRAAGNDHVRGVVPPGAVVAIGADTGKREAWWLSLAMHPDLSWKVVDWSVKTTGDHRAEPTPQQQRDMLDTLRDRATRTGKANAMGIDVGYNTDVVKAWAKKNGYRMVRGDQRPTGKKDALRNKHLPEWADDRTQDDGSHWLFLDGSAIKIELHKALARAPTEAAAGQIPQDQEAGDWLIRHLTSEVWDEKHRVWVKKPGRDNHLLDCLIYAYALAVLSLRLRTTAPAAAPPAQPVAGWVNDARTDGGTSWL